MKLVFPYQVFNKSFYLQKKKWVKKDKALQEQL